MTIKTYDAYINDIYKMGLSLKQLENYKNKGYKIVIVKTYKTNDNDYNSIEIKDTY